MTTTGHINRKKPLTVERIYERADLVGKCRIWTGFLQNRVPHIYDPFKGRMVPVRVALAELIGKKGKPGGFWIARCGNPQCVEAEHMRSLTRSEFSRHMSRTLQNAHPMKHAIRIAKSAKSRRKLTDEQIRYILTSPEPRDKVAAVVGCHPSLVSRYRRGESGHTLASNPWAQLLAA